MTRPHLSGDDAASLLVDLLTARWPHLRARLLDEHTDDGTGRCRGCRVPGYGTPGARWPCLLATVAVEAERRAASGDASLPSTDDAGHFRVKVR